MTVSRYDVVVIGAGIGGLVCATTLAQAGARVAICEAMSYPGGYMATYLRRGYRFPCGPLSFSSPERIRTILADLGLDTSCCWQRSHFRLIEPEMKLLLSAPFDELAVQLARCYPREQAGIQAYFRELRRLMAAMKGMERWEPRLLIGPARRQAAQRLASEHPDYLDCCDCYGGLSSREFAALFVADESLIGFLSQQGEDGAALPAMLAAIMWDLLCERGIWYPSIGIQGITDRLAHRYAQVGGDLLLSQRVDRVLCMDGRVTGVELASGNRLLAEAVVSNADYKQTVLRLLQPADVPAEFTQRVRAAGVTGSDLCVCIGARLSTQASSALDAQHMLYRGLGAAPGDWDDPEKGPDFFRARQIEICLWSQHDRSLAPKGQSVVILRCRAPYAHFARWKGRSRRETATYRSYKRALAKSLITAAEDVLPGLGQAADCVDVATPLTYERYTANHQGAVAGWSWARGASLSPWPSVLSVTPVDGLYAVGHWAASMPFLGAVPTAMHTGHLVAQYLLEGS